MASGFTLNLDGLIGAVERRRSTLVDRVADVLRQRAAQVEADARASAPWQDVTGDARAGLTADVYTEAAEQIVALYLEHGSVAYGLFLETEPGTRQQNPPSRWRWSVILPTLEGHYDAVMADVRSILP